MTKAVAYREKSRTSVGRWLNRNVAGMALASFFSDFGHEMATAILPMFLVSVGASAAALGIIEGVADATSSFAKLGAGWLSFLYAAILSVVGGLVILRLR
jgi:hypothetical protein